MSELTVIEYQKLLAEKEALIEFQSKLLAHRERLSLVGESIENIAHQWKQPLSAISSSAGVLQIHKMLNLLTDELLNQELDEIIRSVDYLSQTINDFKYFFDEKKFSKVFQIEHTIEKILAILKGSLKNKNIQINISCNNEGYAKGVENELMQAIISIIHNATDALILVAPETRTINIALKTEDNFNVLTIQDNAGGIDSKNIDKIFNHYFTTKGDKGSGIGLYMAKRIVEDSFGGNISAHNLNDGACFVISIPEYKFLEAKND